MKRFIDLRGQHTGHRFAWWCTVHDGFDGYNGNEAWDTWEEFEADIDASAAGSLLSRYTGLAPHWVHEPDPDDDYDQDAV